MASDATRVCLFINKNINPATRSLTYRSKDLTLHLQIADGCTMHIHNVYDPMDREEVGAGVAILETALRTHPDGENLAIGDFNLHDESWGGERARKNEKAEQLILLIGNL